MTVEEATRTEEGVPPAVYGADGGIVPYLLRIGVTGHRTLPDDPALAEGVRRAIEALKAAFPPSPFTPVRMAVVSPLAEGADRLVADEVLKQPGAILEAVLPMPRDQYCEDFATRESRTEFDRLLSRADYIDMLPGCESREAAYEQVGRYVADRCDVLIALWDGLPARGRGGTAQVVSWAREGGVPLLWIDTNSPYTLHQEQGSGISRAAFQKLDEFNSASLKPAQFQQQLSREMGRLAEACEPAGLEPGEIEPFCRWVLPQFVRADLLARRSQQRFYALGRAIFMASAAAVIVVAAELLFFPGFLYLTLTEVALMLLILVSLSLGRRSRAHERWTSYRFLAEHFRARFHLALVGVGLTNAAAAQATQLQHPAEEWLRRVIDEVWEQRPRAFDSPRRYKELRRFLGSAWLGDQTQYHEKAEKRNHERHHRVHQRTQAIFAITLLAALCHVVAHLVGLLERLPFLGTDLLFLSLTMPPCAGAVHGIGAQREYLRNAERSREMVPFLKRIKARMDVAPDIAEVRRLAEDAEQLMLSENRDWFVVMQFHDVELHV